MTTTAPAKAPTRPAAPARAVARAEAETNAAMTGRLVAWLRLYWLTILFCGGLVGAGLATVAWSLLASKYESYALLRVASSPFSVSSNRDPNRTKTDFTTAIKTNAQLIKNEFVLNKALGLEVDGVRVSDLPTIKEQKNPFQFLEDELTVGFSDGSEIIKLSLKGHNPDDVRRIVNAVQTAFMQEVVEKELQGRQNFLITLDRILVSYQNTLNEKAGKPKDALPADPKSPSLLPGGVLPAGGPIAAGPPDWIKKQQAVALVTKSIALREQMNDLPVMIASQKARIGMLKKQLETPAPPAEPTPQTGPTAEMIASAVEKDAAVLAKEQDLARLRREAALDADRYQNPNAPGIVAKRERVAQLAAELAELKQKKATLYSQMKVGPAGTSPPSGVNPKIAEHDAAVLRLYELETLLETSKVRLTDTLEQIAKLPPEADPIKPVEFRKTDEKKVPSPDVSRGEAEDSIFRGLAQNAAALRLDLSSPERVTELQKASSPMQKDTKKQLLGTAVAGLLGFAFVGLLCVGYEMSVKKTCGLADVKATVGTPVVGVVPWQNAGSLRDPVRRAEVAESIDKLRAYVTQSCLPRGAATVTITSPHTDEGKSYAAFALANSLADAGFKTLLVDFDLRTPTLHALAGVENRAGVCELLRGEADFKGTIVVLPNELHLLPAGTWTDDARRAAGSGRLEQLLKCLREPFDCVLLHSHPLLTAAESIEVARRSEVVLLCTLCRETTLPLLKKATDRLTAMEVPFSGIVYLGATPKEALC